MTCIKVVPLPMWPNRMRRASKPAHQAGNEAWMGKSEWKFYWQDVANVGLGLWIFVSAAAFLRHAVANAAPWHLITGALPPGSAAMWTMAIVGAAIALFALFAVLAFSAWQEWINLALGLWLFVCPWVLDLDAPEILRWNSVVTGELVAVLAAWVLVQEHTKSRT